MTRCERFEKCSYHSGRLASYSEQIFRNIMSDFCEGDYAACARYQIFCQVGPEHVPADLAPFDQRRALEILAPLRSTIGDR